MSAAVIALLASHAAAFGLGWYSRKGLTRRIRRMSRRL